jgi:hypothetical protein
MISTYAHNKHRESHPLISDYAASSVLTGSMHTSTLTTYDSIQRQNHTHIRMYTPWSCVRDAHIHILDAHTPTRRGHTRRGPTQQSSRAHTRDAFISNRWREAVTHAGKPAARKEGRNKPTSQLVRSPALSHWDPATLPSLAVDCCWLLAVATCWLLPCRLAALQLMLIAVAACWRGSSSR